MENLKETQKESSNSDQDVKIKQQITDLETSKKELDDLTVFLCQFETALLDELRKSSSEAKVSIPEVSDGATRQERLQLFISTYFNFQETRNKQLDLTQERLHQLESAIMEKYDSGDKYVEILQESRDNFNSASEPLKMSAPKNNSKKSLAKKEGLQLNQSPVTNNKKGGGAKKLAGRKKGQVSKNQNQNKNQTQTEGPTKEESSGISEKTTAELFATEPLAPSPLAQDFNDDSLNL